MKLKLNHPIIVIIIFLSSFFAISHLKMQLINYLELAGYYSINTKHLVSILFNTGYSLVSFWLICKYELLNLAGFFNKFKLKNWFLLIFPLYLVLINIPEPGDINFEGVTALNYILLALWSLSVGFSEEFMLRGFTQSLLLKKYGTSKNGVVLSVITAAMIFGLLHLLKFDKGLYGEIAQVLFATFIGTMFGALLLRTHKIWPLVLLHALIDVVGNLDKLEVFKEVSEKHSDNQSLLNSSILALVVLPCFIYGLILLRKIKIEDIQEKI